MGSEEARVRTGARGGGAGLSSATGQVDPGPAPPCLLGGFADQSSVFSRPVGPCAPARSNQSAAAALQSDGGRDWPDTLGGCRGRPPGWTQVCSIVCRELRQRGRQLPQCFRQAGCSPGEDAPLRSRRTGLGGCRAASVLRGRGTQGFCPGGVCGKAGHTQKVEHSGKLEMGARR